MADRALLLLKPQFLGDAVMALPLIDGVASALDETIVMAGSAVREVLLDRSERVTFAPGTKISGIGPVIRAAREIRALRVSHAFLVNRSFRSALAVRLAGVPRRIGHATEGRAFLLTRAIAYDPLRFEAESYLELARSEGLEVPDARPILRLLPHEGELPVADYGIQPGARYAEKQVPIETMAEVARRLDAEGWRPALLGGKDEMASAARLKEKWGGTYVDLVGKRSIRGSMAALASLKAMVGSDTGLMHLAAALGTPTVTVFGPNPASKWGHAYPPHQVLVAPGGNLSQVSSDAIVEATRKAVDSGSCNAS